MFDFLIVFIFLQHSLLLNFISEFKALSHFKLHMREGHSAWQLHTGSRNFPAARCFAVAAPGGEWGKVNYRNSSKGSGWEIKMRIHDYVWKEVVAKVVVFYILRHANLGRADPKCWGLGARGISTNSYWNSAMAACAKFLKAEDRGSTPTTIDRPFSRFIFDAIISPPGCNQ